MSRSEMAFIYVISTNLVDIDITLYRFDVNEPINFNFVLLVKDISHHD